MTTYETTIASFLEDNAEYLRGRVMDFGPSKDSYKHLVRGEYVPKSKNDPPIWVGLNREGPIFNAILCNHIVQSLVDVAGWLFTFQEALWPDGYLVLTYPTSWPEKGPEDLWRFTRCGMELLLRQAGLKILKHEPIDDYVRGNEYIGYGVVCEPAR